MAELRGIEIPDWVEQDITLDTCKSIAKYGCEGDQYGPGFLHYEATQVMTRYGSKVFEYIYETLGEMPKLSEDNLRSWGSLACHYVSTAVELWASQFTDLEEEEEEEDGKARMSESGYSDCGCPECFEIAISDPSKSITLCWECQEAGCDTTGACQCEREITEKLEAFS